MTKIAGTALQRGANSGNTDPPTQQRQIPRKHGSVSGFHVFRGERTIPYESTLERDFITRTEFFLNVLDIIPQPASIEFTAPNGRRYTYTPDFLVYWRLGNREYGSFPKPVLAEVKPEDAWRKHWRRWSTKWKAARRYAREQGWRFEIKDESRIRDEALRNILWLARFKRTQVDEDLSVEILNDLEGLGSTTLERLTQRHFADGDKMIAHQHLWALLAQRHIDCDIHRPLNENTELWVPTNE